MTPKEEEKRRSRRVRDWKPAFLAALARSANVRLSASAACISRKTAYEHREKDAAFAAAWDTALEEACDLLEAEARRRAVEGVDDGVWYKGKKVGKLIRYSDTLLIFLLKAHRPEKYRENARHENWNIDPRQWSDAQLEAYRNGLPLAQVLAMGLDVRYRMSNSTRPELPSWHESATER